MGWFRPFIDLEVHPDKHLASLYEKLPFFRTLYTVFSSRVPSSLSEGELRWIDDICAGVIATLTQHTMKTEYGWKLVSKTWPGMSLSNPHWKDHSQSYKNKDGDIIYTSEPYSLRAETLRELLTYAEEHGFELTLSGRSCYNPGKSFLIELRKKK
jgi:hypothetical protein